MTRDGVCLRTFEWVAQPPSRGVVVVVHGIRDHAMRYEALADALNEKGYAVVSHDLRGHGHSGGHRQRFDSIDQLVADVHELLAEAKQEHGEVPVFVYGHSLGGLVTTHYALEHPDAIDGVILSGPALALLPDVRPGQIRAARFFGTIAPNLPAQPVDDDVFHSTAREREALDRDPLVIEEKLPARSAKAAILAIEEVQARMSDVSVPLLIMHGDADKATNIEGSKKLYRLASSSDKTLEIWEGQYHDLLHEPRKDEVVQTVLRWIESRTP